jgi:hypothetical protein
MAMHQPTPISHRVLQCHMLDVSAANSAAYVSVPWKCKLVKLGATIYVAVTTGDAVITCSRVVAGVATAITGGTITVAQSGSAAGSTFEASPTTELYLNDGDAIAFVSDGGSTETSPTRCWAIVEMMNN